VLDGGKTHLQIASGRTVRNLCFCVHDTTAPFFWSTNHAGVVRGSGTRPLQEVRHRGAHAARAPAAAMRGQRAARRWSVPLLCALLACLFETTGTLQPLFGGRLTWQVDRDFNDASGGQRRVALSLTVAFAQAQACKYAVGARPQCAEFGASSTGGSCQNQPDFLDSTGAGCGVYEQDPSFCSSTEEWANADGVHAGDACCICGGGSSWGGGCGALCTMAHYHGVLCVAQLVPGSDGTAALRHRHTAAGDSCVSDLNRLSGRVETLGGGRVVAADMVGGANNFTVTHLYGGHDTTDTDEFRTLGGAKVVVGRLERVITVAPDATAIVAWLSSYGEAACAEGRECSQSCRRCMALQDEARARECAQTCVVRSRAILLRACDRVASAGLANPLAQPCSVNTVARKNGSNYNASDPYWGAWGAAAITNASLSNESSGLETFVPLCSSSGGGSFSCRERPVRNFFSPVAILPPLVEVAVTPFTRRLKRRSAASYFTGLSYGRLHGHFHSPHPPFAVKAYDRDHNMMVQYNPESAHRRTETGAAKDQRFEAACFLGVGHSGSVAAEADDNATEVGAWPQTQCVGGDHDAAPCNTSSQCRYQGECLQVWSGCRSFLDLDANPHRRQGNYLKFDFAFSGPRDVSPFGLTSTPGRFSQHLLVTADSGSITGASIGGDAWREVPTWQQGSSATYSIFSAYPCDSGVENQPPVFVTSAKSRDTRVPTDVHCYFGEACTIPLHARDFEMDSDGFQNGQQTADTVRIELATGISSQYDTHLKHVNGSDCQDSGAVCCLLELKPTAETSHAASYMAHGGHTEVRCVVAVDLHASSAAPAKRTCRSMPMCIKIHFMPLTSSDGLVNELGEPGARVVVKALPHLENQLAVSWKSLGIERAAQLGNVSLEVLQRNASVPRTLPNMSWPLGAGEARVPLSILRAVLQANLTGLQSQSGWTGMQFRFRVVVGTRSGTRRFHGPWSTWIMVFAETQLVPPLVYGVSWAGNRLSMWRLALMFNETHSSSRRNGSALSFHDFNSTLLTPVLESACHNTWCSSQCAEDCVISSVGDQTDYAWCMYACYSKLSFDDFNSTLNQTCAQEGDLDVAPQNANYTLVDTFSSGSLSQGAIAIDSTMRQVFLIISEAGEEPTAAVSEARTPQLLGIDLPTGAVLRRLDLSIPPGVIWNVEMDEAQGQLVAASLVGRGSQALTRLVSISTESGAISVIYELTSPVVFGVSAFDRYSRSYFFVEATTMRPRMFSMLSGVLSEPFESEPPTLGTATAGEFSHRAVLAMGFEATSGLLFALSSEWPGTDDSTVFLTRYDPSANRLVSSFPTVLRNTHVRFASFLFDFIRMKILVSQKAMDESCCCASSPRGRLLVYNYQHDSITSEGFSALSPAMLSMVAHEHRVPEVELVIPSKATADALVSVDITLVGSNFGVKPYPSEVSLDMFRCANARAHSDWEMVCTLGGDTNGEDVFKRGRDTATVEITTQVIDRETSRAQAFAFTEFWTQISPDSSFAHQSYLGSQITVYGRAFVSDPDTDVFSYRLLLTADERGVISAPPLVGSENLLVFNAPVWPHAAAQCEVRLLHDPQSEPFETSFKGYLALFQYVTNRAVNYTYRESWFAVEPTWGYASSQGEITVTGLGFDPERGDYKCEFDGLPGLVDAVPVSPREVRCRLPVWNQSAGVTCMYLRNHDMRVSRYTEEQSGTCNINVSAPFLVVQTWDALDPSQSPVSGGVQVTIQGAGFDRRQSYTCVFEDIFNGVSTVTARVIDPTGIICTTPVVARNAMGTVVLVMQNTSNVSTYDFEFLPLGPAVVPTTARATGGTLVVVYAWGHLDVNGKYACAFSALDYQAWSENVTVSNVQSVSCHTPFWAEAAGMTSVRVWSWAAEQFVVSLPFEMTAIVLAVQPTLVPAGEEVVYIMHGAGLNHSSTEYMCQLMDPMTQNLVVSAPAAPANDSTMICPHMSWTFAGSQSEYTHETVRASLMLGSAPVFSDTPLNVTVFQVFTEIQPSSVSACGGAVVTVVGAGFDDKELDQYSCVFRPYCTSANCFSTFENDLFVLETRAVSILNHTHLVCDAPAWYRDALTIPICHGNGTIDDPSAPWCEDDDCDSVCFQECAIHATYSQSAWLHCAAYCTGYVSGVEPPPQNTTCDFQCQNTTYWFACYRKCVIVHGSNHSAHLTCKAQCDDALSVCNQDCEEDCVRNCVADDPRNSYSESAFLRCKAWCNPRSDSYDTNMTIGVRYGSRVTDVSYTREDLRILGEHEVLGEVRPVGHFEFLGEITQVIPSSGNALGSERVTVLGCGFPNTSGKWEPGVRIRARFSSNSSCEEDVAVTNCVFKTKTSVVCVTPIIRVADDEGRTWLTIEMTQAGNTMQSWWMPESVGRFVGTLAFQVAAAFKSVLPAVARASSPVEISVEGYSFQRDGNYSCQFIANGLPIISTPCSFVSSILLRCSTPVWPYRSGTFAVAVSDGDYLLRRSDDGNSSVTTQSFRFEAEIWSMSPDRGLVGDNTTVNITGSGLDASRWPSSYVCAFHDNLGRKSGNSTAVRLQYDETSEAQVLTCLVPDWIFGAGMATLRVADTVNDLWIPPRNGSAVAFVFQLLEVVHRVQPTVGPISGGFAITVFGRGFQNDTVYRAEFARNEVHVSANARVLGDSMLVVTVPKFSAAAGQVQLNIFRTNGAVNGSAHLMYTEILERFYPEWGRVSGAYVTAEGTFAIGKMYEFRLSPVRSGPVPNISAFAEARSAHSIEFELPAWEYAAQPMSVHLLQNGTLAHFVGQPSFYQLTSGWIAASLPKVTSFHGGMQITIKGQGFDTASPLGYKCEFLEPTISDCLPDDASCLKHFLTDYTMPEKDREPVNATSTTEIRCWVPTWLHKNPNAILRLLEGKTIVEKLYSGAQSTEFVGQPRVENSGNAPTRGRVAVMLKGADFGLVDLTQKARIGNSACESTRWLSSTSLSCIVPTAVNGTLTTGIAVTVGPWRIGTADRGFIYDGLMCQPGTFSDVVSGHKTCSPCAVGKFSAGQIWGSEFATTACTDCPAFTSSPVGSESAFNCTCDAGYTGQNGQACRACAPGTYKNQSGPHQCLQCGRGQYASSSAVTACSTCPVGKAGTVLGASGCVTCAEGTYFPHVQGATQCFVCPAGKILPVVGTSTANCTGDLITVQANAQVSVNASAFAQYEADFIASVAQAAAVPVDRVRIVSVTEVSSRRRLLATSVVITFEIIVARADGAETEQVVREELVEIIAKKGLPHTSVMLILKTCGVGLEPNNETLRCDPCAKGYYKESLGNQSCSACPLNMYGTEIGATSRSTCLPCVGGSTSANGSEACSCQPGATGPPGACKLCETGKFKASAGSEACVTCSVGKYSHAGFSECTKCPDNSISAAGSTSQSECTCIAGYTQGASGVCVACGYGTFKMVSGPHLCQACPPGTFLPSRGSNSR